MCLILITAIWIPSIIHLFVVRVAGSVDPIPAGIQPEAGQHTEQVAICEYVIWIHICNSPNYYSQK